MTVCERIQRQLAVSNREWSAIEREQMETHLQSCAQCATVAGKWAAQARLLSTLPRHSMSRERQRGLIARTHREGKGLRMRVRLAQGLRTAAGVLVLALVTVSMAVLFRYLASWQGEALTFTPAPPAAPVVPPQPRVERQIASTRLTDVLVDLALSLVPGLLLGGFTVLVVGLLWRRSDVLRQGIGPLLSLSGPVLLTAAHLLAVGALISFGARVGAYPLHIVGLAIYVVSTALSVAAVGIQIRHMGRTDVDTASLLLASVPAFPSLTLRAGLWMTPFLGGALYAPYDPGETALVEFSMVLFVTLWTVVSITYSSFRYLAVTYVMQVVLALATYILPVCRLYGQECLWAESGMLLLLTLHYLGGAAVVGLRNVLLKRRKPGLWAAPMMTSLVGAWILSWTLNWLPRNGAYLGWVAKDFYVPDGAWDWARSAAHALAVAVMAVAVPSGILAALRSRRRPEPAPGRGADGTPTDNVD
jgi:hypothetical protein